MVSKTITVTKQAFDSIQKIKRADESYSEFFLRISKVKRDPADFFGMLKGADLDYKKRRKGMDKLYEERHNALFGHKRHN